VFWGIVNIFVGILFLILGFSPQWISEDLRRELSSKPNRITFFKWSGPILLGLGALMVLGIL